MRVMRQLAVFGLSMSLAACGGDDDSVECPAFSACGGDPTGDWTFVDTCVDDAEIDFDIEGCPEATARFQDDIAISGTLSLGEDGSYAVEQSLTGTLVLSFPLSCLEGEADSCDQVGEILEVECTASGDVCECEDSADFDSEASGTYETDGSSITFTTSGGEPSDPGEFCVDGDRLELRSPENETGVMSTLFLERS
jgi:hypothetical protein